MEAVCRNTALAVPVPPEAGSGPLSFRSAPLRRALVNADPFTIAGRRAHATGRANRGITDLEFDGVPSVHDLRIEHSVYDHGAITSLGLERTLRSGNSVLTEHSIILPDVSALTTEWTSAVGTSITLTWRLEAPLTDRGIEWNTSADGIVAKYAAGETIAVVFSMPPVSLDVVPAIDRGRRSAAAVISARIPVSASGTRMHIICARSGDASAAIAQTLAALRNLLPLSRSLNAVQVRSAHAGISIATPDAALDEAFEWARHRVAVTPFEQARPIDAFVNALAGLVANDQSVARGMIGSIRGTPADYLIALARYFSWTGDAPFVGMEWDHVQAAVHELLRVGPDHEAALWTTALAGIATAAGDVGQAAMAADLEAVVKRERIAHAAALRNTHWLESLAHPATTAWLHALNGEDVRAQRRIQGAAARVLLPGADPAALLIPVVFGLLGVEPDATRGRLRLRPRMPAAWNRIDVHGIPAGDASVSMSWRRVGSTSEYRFRQDHGPVPQRLIFEPLLAPAPLTAATVDGQPAALDPRLHAGRMLVPVQLVLDEERVVTMTTG